MSIEIPLGLRLVVVVGGREYQLTDGYASLDEFEQAVTAAVTDGQILVLNVFRPGSSEAQVEPARGVLVVDGRLTTDIAALALIELEAGKPGIDTTH